MKSNNKNYILSIETTSKICGVALIKNNKIVTENNIDKGLNHSVTLFDNIHNIIKTIDFNEISKIKVSNGPGSFTGIRIGIAAAIGLSEKYNTDIEYVNTLDSLSYNIKEKGDYILSMLDAKVDRVYIALYKSKTLKKLSNDCIANVEELCKLLNDNFKSTDIEFSLVGDGAVNYKDVFKKSLSINYKIYNKYSNLKASSVAFTDGSISKIPIINYILASKAERERNGNS